MKRDRAMTDEKKIEWDKKNDQDYCQNAKSFGHQLQDFPFNLTMKTVQVWLPDWNLDKIKFWQSIDDFASCNLDR